MDQVYVATGTVTDGVTIRLDEALPPGVSKVRVTVEPVPDSGAKKSYLEVMEEIRAAQEARGHVPPTREEAEAWIREERDIWAERDARNLPPCESTSTP